MRKIGVVALGVIVGLALPAASQAGTVTAQEGFLAPAGEVNDVTLNVDFADPTTKALIYRDAGAPLTAGAGCEAIADGGVRCPGGSTARVILGDQDDQLTVRDPFLLGPKATVHGGEGDDTIHAGASGGEYDGDEGDDALDGSFNFGSVTFRGGPGNDALRARSVVDARLSGEDGDDTLSASASAVAGLRTIVDGGDGADALDGTGSTRGIDLRGGAGPDRIEIGWGARATYADRSRPVLVSLDGQANDGGIGEGDNVVPCANPPGRCLDRPTLEGGASHDLLDGIVGDQEIRLIGGSGIDTARYSRATIPVTVDLAGLPGMENVIGGPFDDAITGSDTANLLTGGAGADRLSGLGGTDILLARDGETDELACGEGRDLASADAQDQVASDCDLP